MKMKRVALFLVLGTLAAVAARTSAMIPEQVKIDMGLVAGTAGAGQASVRVFKGIPFAAPPLGENRWRAPQPPARWDGVKNAGAFGAPCTSGPAAGRGGAGRGARGADGARGAAAPPAQAAPAAPREPARSEDCLHLNVWTSAARAGDRRPVMVWIYGGGFTGGSGGLQWYDGENLAAKGPVIVTFNYRLGSLGFFAHPELAKESGHNASGNYGMMDAIAALQWVKRNISAFGGDPNNVTVAGESAGAIMVGALVGSPQAKGLFNRAIAESGGWMGLTMGRMRQGATAQADGVKAMDALGVKTIRELRVKPLDELTGLSAGGLAVDGYLIPQDESLTFMNGQQNAVDVLTGSNQDEANFGVCGPGAGAAGRGGQGMTVDAFKSAAQRKFGELADQYLQL
jgi:para-nitrobenzyl esterase